MRDQDRPDTRGPLPVGNAGDAIDLGLLFHRLNNQLGIILANAELLEAKSLDEIVRSRSGQIVASVLDALATAKDIRLRTRPPAPSNI